MDSNEKLNFLSSFGTDPIPSYKKKMIKRLLRRVNTLVVSISGFHLASP